MNTDEHGLRLGVDSPAMTILRLLLAAFVVMPAVRQGATTSVEPGYTSLFNGTDLTDWKIAGPLEAFSVKEGAIVANGSSSHAYYNGPVGKHAFRNFELKIDVMTRRGSNGGIYVLTEFE